MRVYKALFIMMISTVFIFLTVCGMAPKAKKDSVAEKADAVKASEEKMPVTESAEEVKEAETRRINKGKVEEVVKKAKLGIDKVFKEESEEEAAGAHEEAVEDDEDEEPKPTVTPSYKLTKSEIKYWANVNSSKILMDKCENDVVEHEKFLRKRLDKELLAMQDHISTMHTSPVIHDRDKIEYIWEGLTKTAEATFSITTGKMNELKENRDTMKRLQKENRAIMDKKSGEIQKMDQVKSWYKTIQSEVKRLDKSIIHLDEVFDRYMFNYKKILAEKEKTIKTKLDTHNELHKY